MSNDILTSINTKATSQKEKAKPNQVFNNAGGAVFQVSPETRIRRFLILGTTGGTFYQGEKELTKDNAEIVIDWATNNTKALVDIVVEISEAGRAPKQNPTIFALAAAAGLGDDEGRAYALSMLPRVARTGTHLFLFSRYVEQFRGWGRGLRNAVGKWYETKTADSAAYQAVKYRQREGWSHRDLLRLAHPAGATQMHKNLYDWITKGQIAENEFDVEVPHIVAAFVAAQKTTDVSRWIELINKFNMTWEMLPDAALKEAAVWEAMLDKGMPMGALIRQLPRLTNLGVLKGARLTKVIGLLSDKDSVTKARIHPMNVLIAQRTYAGGVSLRGSGRWAPIAKIVDALDAAFYVSFGNVEPSNKRILNALDVSGSMDWNNIAGLPITPRVAAGAMSLITLATEPAAKSVAFSNSAYAGRYGAPSGLNIWNAPSNINARYSSGISEIPLSSRQRLDDVLKTIDSMPAGGTDCALPMVWAKETSQEFDTFIIWTDNETWAGAIHPFQALKEYRKASGIDARLIVCGMTATDFSIADPSDAGMLDVVGLDSATPQMLSDFGAGRI